MAPDQLQQQRHRLVCRVVTEHGKERACEVALEKHTDHIRPVASTERELLFVTKIIVAVADALVVIRRSGLEAKDFDEVRICVRVFTDVRKLQLERGPFALQLGEYSP